MPTIECVEPQAKQNEAGATPSGTHKDLLPPIPRASHLPDDVIYEIARHATELSIWRMMACSRGMRTAAEKALKPHLMEKVITGNPPWPSEERCESYLLTSDRTGPGVSLRNQSANVPDFAWADQDDLYSYTRRRQIKAINDRFNRHLAAYAPASVHLRSAVIEVRDGDSPGWGQLQRLGPLLEALELHILDSGPQEVAQYKLDHRQLRSRPAYPYHYPQLGMPQSLLYPESDFITFDRLTSLTLIATSRCLHYLTPMLRVAPNVRSLTIKSPSYRGSDEDLYFRLGSHTCPLGKLEELHIIGCGLIGSANIGLGIWTNWLPDTPTLRRLIIRTPPVFSVPIIMVTTNPSFVEQTPVCTYVDSLALDETSSHDFVLALPEIKRLAVDVVCFQNISNLVLERSRGKGKRKFSYPLLEIVSMISRQY
jgi:hypothetical protein